MNTITDYLKTVELLAAYRDRQVASANGDVSRIKALWDDYSQDVSATRRLFFPSEGSIGNAALTPATTPSVPSATTPSVPTDPKCTLRVRCIDADADPLEFSRFGEIASTVKGDGEYLITYKDARDAADARTSLPWGWRLQSPISVGYRYTLYVRRLADDSRPDELSRFGEVLRLQPMGNNTYCVVYKDERDVKYVSSHIHELEGWRLV